MRHAMRPSVMSDPGAAASATPPADARLLRRAHGLSREAMGHLPIAEPCPRNEDAVATTSAALTPIEPDRTSLGRLVH